ncbi:MAG: glutathione S-transferase family protein [Deltaproteobacteria bacterium]|nr:MAG: glutathione S-transferase family protein [Deltaproteobacteria bacterium]TMA67983.1 MAG: glutathione S-transferase family protein [Deltaproteobacteria bacterium]TMB45912.1 MAG: glutathione S-transferase family protein [Deltaproteobacteria bacterium]
MKLYYSTQSRAVRPRWMLEEIGAPYELVRLQLGTDTKTPAYLKINPNGTVPALVDGDLVLFESAAICQYLADRHPEKRLAPPVGTPARGLYYQWIHYAMSGLEPPLVTIFLHTIRKPEAERIPALVAEARTQLGTVLGVIEQAVLGRTFILGDQLTAADVMVGSTLVWAQMMSLLGDQQPATAAYLARLASRPAFQRAMGD